MSIFIDTGPLYAFFDQRDQYNRWTGEQFAKIIQPLITCEAVIAETVFLMLGSGISPYNLFEFTQREHLQILPVLSRTEGRQRIREIISKYSNLPASVADASLCIWQKIKVNQRFLRWTIILQSTAHRKTNKFL